ncbi:MAG: Ig-like domain-containing protein [Patescibacteria group bacterium]|jgi:hypothetical protein
MNIASSLRLSQARYLAYAMTAVITTAIGFFLFTSNALAVAPTTFTSKVYTDGSGDGTVETMVVVIDGLEALTACVVTAPELTADWTYVGNGIGGSIASATCDAPTATITFTITGANAFTTGGVTAPTIAYANAGAADSIANATGVLGAVGAVSLSDQAKPVIKSTAGRFTLDNDNNGTVDYVKVIYTEPIDDGSLSASEFCVSETSGSCVAGDLAETFTSLTPASGNETDSASDATVYIGVAGGTITTNKTDYTLAVQMTGSVNDGAGIAALAEGSATNSADGAAPIYVSSSTLDNNNNGTVDFVKVVYSEAILDSSVASPDASADFAVGIADTTAGNIAESFTSLTPSSGLETDTANDATIYIGVASSGETLSANKTDYMLKIQQVGAVTDSVPNSLASFTLKTSSDGAKPIIKTSAGRFTLDNDNNGTVDYVKVVFSEAIDDGSLSASEFCASETSGSCVAGDLTETFTALTPASGNETDSASDATVYIGVAGGTISTNKTDYTLSIQLTGSVNDASGRASIAEGSATNSADGAKPIVVTAVTSDNGANGSVDRLVLTFSESVTVTDGETDNDFTLVASTGTAAIVAGTYGATASTLTYTILPSTTLNTGITVTPTYATAGAGSVIDASTNEMLNGETVTGTDGVAPVVVSVSPTSGATGVNRDSDVVITFSEAMDTTFAEGAAAEFTISPNPTGTQSGAFDGTNKIVTIALPTLNCGGVYSVATIQANIDASAGSPTGLLTTGPSTGDWTFTTVGCGSTGGSGGSGTIVRSILLNSPNGGQTYNHGEIVTVSWTGSNVGTVNLSYATSASGTYTSIASNLGSTGSYSWTVPDVTSNDVFIKAEAYDGSTLQASDSSDTAVSIVGTSAPIVPPAVNQPTVGTGVSPFTGLPEAINAVAVGDVLRGQHYSTVYYIDGNLKRQPFQDAQTYFTYYSSWNNVRTVTDATLSTLTIGKPMLPKAGVVLVKIVSDPRVYALQTDSNTGATLLRWVPTESVAIALYGASWADYVIDLTPTLYTQFGHGADMTSSVTVDRSIMKTRVHLNQ